MFSNVVLHCSLAGRERSHCTTATIRMDTSWREAWQPCRSAFKKKSSIFTNPVVFCLITGALTRIRRYSNTVGRMRRNDITLRRLLDVTHCPVPHAHVPGDHQRAGWVPVLCMRLRSTQLTNKTFRSEPLSLSTWILCRENHYILAAVRMKIS